MNIARVFLPTLFAAIAACAAGQSTNFSGFNYQAVVRDANGDPLPNQNVGVQLVISCGILQPYVEDHSVTTDANGLMDLVIGEGTPVFGSAPFNTIDWSGCGTWTWNVTVSMDITGGTNYSLVGSQQMKAVPFALNALSTTTQPLTGWALVADDVFTTHPGNVGIGTNAPAHKLDVQGAINAGGGLYVGDQQTITYDGAGRTEFFDEAGIEHLEFNGYNTTFGAQPTYFNDHLGIGLIVGVESATADLHVKGTFRLEDGSQGAGKVLTSDADGNASWGLAAAATGWALNGNDLHNTNSGRVGIGTNTPDAKLTLGTPGVTWTDYGLTSDSRIGVVNGPGGRKTAIMQIFNNAAAFGGFDYASGLGINTLLNPFGGNVGIGTTTPLAPLHIGSGTGNEVLRVSSAVTPAWLSLVENGTRRGILAFGPSAVSLQADGANYLNLYTDGVPRLQVAPAGRIGIATAAPAARLHVNHDDGEPGIAIQNASAVDRWFMYMQPSSKSLSLFYNGVLKGSFEPSGGVYTAVSDGRLKTNIAPVGTGMMERIDQLQPVRYRFTDQPDEARQHLGFIAQDLAEVFPEVVYHNPEDGVYTVAYTELVPVLVAAMQEQHDRVEALEAENAELARTLAANTALMLELQEALRNER